MGPRGWYIANSHKAKIPPTINENEGQQSSVSSKSEPDSKASVKDIRNYSEQLDLVEPRLGPRGWYIANSHKAKIPPTINENEGQQSSVSSKSEPDSKASVKDIRNYSEQLDLVEPRLGPWGWYIANYYKAKIPPSITENEGQQSSVSCKSEPDSKSAGVKDIRNYSEQLDLVEPRLGPQGWYITNSYEAKIPPSTTENEGQQSSVSSKRETDSKPASAKDITVSAFSRLCIPHGGAGGVSLNYLPPPLCPIPDVVFGNTAFSHVSQEHIRPGDVKCHVKDITVNNKNTEYLLEFNIETNNLRIPEKLLIQPKKNNSQLDEETYNLEKFKENAMIIFNHEEFLVCDERRGTALDVAALEDTFKQFRFHVTTYNDLTEEELFDKLERFSKNNINDYGCLCVAILTHGRDGGFLMAKDAEYSERDVFSCFDARTKPELAAKPIIFLIQACRGSAAAARVPHDPRQNVEFDASENSCRPTEADMIMFHSSYFGRASARVVKEGSWFIQTLCEQMKLHGSTHHLEELFLRVRRIVALEKEYNGVKQMPTVTSTLLYKLYLKKIDDAL